MAAKSLVAAATQQKKKKRGLPIAIISLVALLLLLITIIYFTLFQKPERVVEDALKSVLTSQSAGFSASTMSEGNGMKMMVSSEGFMKAGELQGTVTYNYTSGSSKASAPVQFVAAKDGKGYVKIDNAPQKLNEFLPLIASAGGSNQKASESTVKLLKSTYEPIANEVNGKWVMMATTQNQSQIPTAASSSNISQACTDLVRLVQLTPADGQKLWQEYQSHPFIKNVTSADADISSLGYKLSYDQKLASDFAGAVKSTKVGAAMVQCLGIGQTASQTTPSYEIQVDRVTHSLKKLIIHEPQTGSSPVHTEVSLKLGQSGSVTVPTTALNIADVMKKSTPQR
jgi:hypothetical protein